MRDLKGKTAVVTGAGSGIGLGIARALAGAGINLVLADIQQTHLDEARAAIEAKGGRAITLPTDVSDPDQVAAVARVAQEHFGKLHVAVNNAGIAMHGTPVADVSTEAWRRVLGVNVLGVINGIHAFVPAIRGHGEGGHVVNTASISGFFIRRGSEQGAYSMTKYAVVALSEALKQELDGSGIGVSVLCPGPVRTRIFEGHAITSASPRGSWAPRRSSPPRSARGCCTPSRTASSTSSPTARSGRRFGPATPGSKQPLTRPMHSGQRN